MSQQVQIREFRYPADYEDALHLWEAMEVGVKVGRSDTATEICKKLERDPDLFLVAETSGKVVGTVIGGYDGRRGMIYHLAVQADLRRRGLATQLLAEVEKRLQAKGCIKSYLMVVADNDAAIEFYEHRGWREMRGNRVLAKELP